MRPRGRDSTRRRPRGIARRADDVTLPRGWRYALATLALAAVLALAWIVHPQVGIGSDSIFALAWGSELAEGRLPDFSDRFLPSKHPLTIGMAIVVAPLTPRGSIDAYSTLGVLGFLAVLYGTFRLGRAVAGVGAGALAAILVAARPDVEYIASLSLAGGPWVALVLLAGALAIESGTRRWRAVLSLLTVAGLLRPESWGLALAYGVWVASRSDSWRHRIVIGALVLAAPALWLAFDAALTGNALQSIQHPGGGGVRRVVGTQDVQPAWVEESTACPSELPGCGIGNAVGTRVGWPLGLAGALIAAWALWSGRRILLSGLREERLEGESASLWPLILVSFAVLGVMVALPLLRLFGFELAPRVVLLPAIALVVLAAAAPFVLRRSTISVALGVILAPIVVVSTIGGLGRSPDLIRYQADGWGRLQDLVALVEAPVVREAVMRCPQLEVSARGAGIAQEAHSGAALVLGLEPADIEVTSPGDPYLPPGGSLVAYDPPRRPTAARTEGDWVFASRCSP
jgi:hypothetical protein